MPSNKYRRNNGGKKLSMFRKISEKKFDEKQNICIVSKNLFTNCLLMTKEIASSYKGEIWQLRS